jgi:hypothetical protein
MSLTYPFCLGVAVLVGSFTDMCMWISIVSILGRVIFLCMQGTPRRRLYTG